MPEAARRCRDPPCSTTGQAHMGKSGLFICIHDVLFMQGMLIKPRCHRFLSQDSNWFRGFAWILCRSLGARALLIFSLPASWTLSLVHYEMHGRRPRGGELEDGKVRGAEMLQLQKSSSLRDDEFLMLTGSLDVFRGFPRLWRPL